MLLAGLALAGCAGDSDRPNVLIVVVDTLRADHLTSYGYERGTDGALADFFDSATMFTEAYAPSSWTRPSVATLFTGLFDSYEAKALADPYNRAGDECGSGKGGILSLLQAVFSSLVVALAAVEVSRWLGRGIPLLQLGESELRALSRALVVALTVTTLVYLFSTFVVGADGGRLTDR